MPFIRDRIRFVVLLGAILCAACGGPDQAARPTAVPSPLPGGGARPAASTPTKPPQALNLTGSGTPAPASAAGEQALYLWPAYVPPGMAPAPQESLVSGTKEVGSGGLGFYIITLNGSATKLTIGGGGIDTPLPLDGEQRRVTASGRAGTLITSGDRREIIFDVSPGKLFLYSAGLSEQDLLKVADSLQPIDVEALRVLAGVR